jgi:hypothetical protein
MIDQETMRVRRGPRRRSAPDTATVAKKPEATEAGSSKQIGAGKKEEEAMAEPATNGSRRFTDFVNSIVGAVRDIAARSIDANASFAKQMLDFQAQFTSWARDTPLGPMFQSQYEFGEGLIKFSADAARALWGIEKAKSES